MLSKRSKKILLIAVAIATMTAVFTIAVAAADDFNAAETMGTAFQSVVANIFEMIATILPIALQVLGVTIAIYFGIKWFNKIMGRT